MSADKLDQEGAQPPEITIGQTKLTESQASALACLLIAAVTEGEIVSDDPSEFVADLRGVIGVMASETRKLMN